MSETRRYKAALLFGAPGVGKGTQGRILGQIPGFFHLSCGDVFRAIDIGSDEGQEIYRYSSQGELVPDDLTYRIWRKALEAHMALSSFKPREDLLILDGIPRNLPQAEMIEEIIDVRKVVHLVCADVEKMVERMRRRAIRENRVDDANEQTIRHRFRVYETETTAVLDYYPSELISRVDALGSPAGVLRKLLDVLVPVQDELFVNRPKPPVAL
ncbi:MAG: nucleoside monophosphate kinase [Planctomycetaceae bacterium]